MRFTIRLAVAAALLFGLFAVLLFIQPHSYQPPPDVVPGMVSQVTSTSPHVTNSMTSARDRVRLSETLSPSAKSVHTTLLYGPVTYRLCTYCWNVRTRNLR